MELVDVAAAVVAGGSWIDGLVECHRVAVA